MATPVRPIPPARTGLIMRLALLLYHYDPRDPVSRHVRQFAAELQERGHHCRVYYLSWQGEPLPGAELRRVPARALKEHRREARYRDWVWRDLEAEPVDGVIGFGLMPGVDVYFTAGPCYLDEALTGRGWGYRRGGRFRRIAALERAVFAPDSDTEILLVSGTEREKFERHYHTPAARLHLLPPGVSPGRRRPEDASRRRRALREGLDIGPLDYVLLFVGQDASAGGLDRVIRALARVREEQPSVNARLMVVGHSAPRQIRQLARKLDTLEAIEFLGARDDLPDLMLVADVLVHPARRETDVILPLEALVTGLPVVVSEGCGCAQHIRDSRGGIILPSPFDQDLFERAVLRMLDGIYRADCRESARMYLRLTDLYTLYSTGADLIERLIVTRRQGSTDQASKTPNG